MTKSRHLLYSGIITGKGQISKRTFIASSPSLTNIIRKETGVKLGSLFISILKCFEFKRCPVEM